MTLYTGGLKRALQDYAKATKKDEAEILNRAGRNVAIKAIQRTKKASKERIKQDMLKDKRAIRQAVVALQAKGKKVTRKSVGTMARKITASRVRASGYTAGPGWSNAAKAFGGRGVKTDKRFPRSLAKHGSGKKATPRKLLAMLTNTAPAASKEGFVGLQRAINETAIDMKSHAAKKMKQTAARHSAR